MFLACKGVAPADDSDCGGVTAKGAHNSFKLNCETPNGATNNNKACKLGIQRFGADVILHPERCGGRHLTAKHDLTTGRSGPVTFSPEALGGTLGLQRLRRYSS